jgi:hypothetical protein
MVQLLGGGPIYFLSEGQYEWHIKTTDDKPLCGFEIAYYTHCTTLRRTGRPGDDYQGVPCRDCEAIFYNEDNVIRPDFSYPQEVMNDG